LQNVTLLLLKEIEMRLKIIIMLKSFFLNNITDLRWEFYYHERIWTTRHLWTL